MPPLLPTAPVDIAPPYVASVTLGAALHPGGPRYYRHGLRASEISSVTVSDFDLDQRRIMCRRNKASINNWQAMAEDEVEAVRAVLQDHRREKSPFLFGTRQSHAISRSQFYRVFRALAHDAGIPAEKRHPHVLKHSLGTHLANAGVPLQVIQHRLGHRCLKNTMVYLEIANAHADEQCELARCRGGVV